MNTIDNIYSIFISLILLNVYNVYTFSKWAVIFEGDKLNLEGNPDFYPWERENNEWEF